MRPGPHFNDFLKMYSLLYVDRPPWHFAGPMFNKKRKHTYLPYPILKLDQLKALNVPTLTNPNCLLFMWTTSTHLQLAEHWGFSYSTVVFVWDKQRTCPAL